MTATLSRSVGELTSPEISLRLKPTSILCLPLGAIEQHGPHLPLNTDVVVAEGLTRRIIARWGEEFDLWQLPTVALGLSREHDWAAGTLSLSVQGFAGLLREIAREVVRALPARNLAIVNGHGGNRGILENLLHEFAGDFRLNACAIHPFDLAKVEMSADHPDVHGGKSETAVMLALAPELVRRDLIARTAAGPDRDAVHGLIFDRGATFPWRTDDARLAHAGIIGDAQSATPELGESIVASMVDVAHGVLERLKGRQKFMPDAETSSPR
jgi:creatinine amidohydrolase/Fe(II)-dependent formamide hydrolase-like protein